MIATSPQPPGERASWRGRLVAARWLWVPTLLFLLTRGGIVLVAYLAQPLIADSPTIAPYHVRPDDLLLDGFGSRWDTGFYTSIATEGYRFEGVRLPSVAFFPLLPLLIRAAMPLFGGDALVAGLAVTNLALWGACLLFYRLVTETWGEEIAERALLYLLIFPTAFFGSAIYSESLFLFCALGTLLLSRRGYWESSAALAIAATASRFMGLLVVPLLVGDLWRRRQAGDSIARTAWLAPLLAPLGTLGYMAFLQRSFGNALAFAHASAAWGREPQSLIESIAELLTPPAMGWGAALRTGALPLDNWIDLLLPLLFLLFGLVLLRQRRWGEALFVLLGVLIPLNSGLLMSQRRYIWVLFPVFILLAQWARNRWVDRVVVLSSLLLLGLFTALFVNWYWVA